MKHQDLYTLQILEELGNETVPSQRALAKKLNVSLGLVNSFMKRLAQKGYFKIRTIPRNRVKYILTSKGITEKTRLTYHYIQHSYQFYKGARQKLRDLFIRLMEMGAQRVVFCGATELTEIAFVSLQETSLELMAIVDEQKIGEEFLRHTVCAPEALKNIAFDKILIMDLGAREGVLEQLNQLGIPGNKIAMLE